MFDKWLYDKLSDEDSAIYKTYFLMSKPYKINTANCYTQYSPGCYGTSNGLQSIEIKRIDLLNFNLQMFFYERKMYVTCFSSEAIDCISSVLHQELLYSIIPN